MLHRGNQQLLLVVPLLRGSRQQRRKNVKITRRFLFLVKAHPLADQSLSGVCWAATPRLIPGHPHYYCKTTAAACTWQEAQYNSPPKPFSHLDRLYDNTLRWNGVGDSHCVHTVLTFNYERSPSCITPDPNTRPKYPLRQNMITTTREYTRDSTNPLSLAPTKRPSKRINHSLLHLTIGISYRRTKCFISLLSVILL